MIEWQTVRCIKQHAYSGKMREEGSIYDMKPRYAKLLAQQGKVEFVFKDAEQVEDVEVVDTFIMDATPIKPVKKVVKNSKK